MGYALVKAVPLKDRGRLITESIKYRKSQETKNWSEKQHLEKMRELGFRIRFFPMPGYYFNPEIAQFRRQRASQTRQSKLKSRNT